MPKGVKDITHKVDTDKFHIFPDKSSGTHTYEGSGADTVQFFKDTSNFDKIISGLDITQREAFEEWASGYFMGSNKVEKFSDLSKRSQQLLRIYDKTLDKSNLTEGLVVRRLASFSLINNGSRSIPSKDELKAMEGNLVKLNMPLSTSAAAEGLTIGTMGKNVEYVFHIPGGTVGSGMWIGDTRINGWGAKQREFMVNRDTVYQQGPTTYNSKRGVYEVNLYYIGREKHKYK